MAETLTIRTSASTDVIKVVERGPQGPTGPQGPAGEGGGAPAVTEIEVPNNGTSTTTLTTGQLPARVILFLDADPDPTATINLPTPGVRESGLLASIKVQVEGGTASSALVTVVHDAVTLLNSYELDEDESSIDFLWDGYAWTYSSTSRLRSYPNRVLQLPSTSGTIALTSQAADMEITDSTKGVILKSPNNTRYRLTVSNSGLPIFTALLLFLLVSLAPAQNVGMATDTNGTILTDRTNSLTFTNPVAWNNSTNAATTISNLFSSNSLPSGAAASTAILTANGTGGSAFVVPRVFYVVKTNVTSRTNWGQTDWFFSTNNDPDLKVDLDANTLYRIEYGARWVTGTNSIAYTFASTGGAITATNYALRNGIRVGFNAVVASITAGTNVTTTGATIDTASSDISAVGGYFTTRTGASNITLHLRWWPTVSNAVVTTLTTDSWFRVEKISP